MASPNKTQVAELKWIEDDNTYPELARRDDDKLGIIGQRSFKENILRKCQENWSVPVGLFATTACLGLGLLNMKKGNVEKQQMFMRGRVGFQAFTLAAMFFTMWYAQKKHSKERRNQ